MYRVWIGEPAFLPTKMAAAGQTVWVSGYETGNASSVKLMPFDAHTGAAVRPVTIPVGESRFGWKTEGPPTPDIAIDTNGGLWLTVFSAGQVIHVSDPLGLSRSPQPEEPSPSGPPFVSQETWPGSGASYVGTLTWGDTPPMGPWLFVVTKQASMGDHSVWWHVESSYKGEPDMSIGFPVDLPVGQEFSLRFSCIPCDTGYPVAAFGSTAEDVARIQIDLIDGRRIDATMLDVPEKLRDSTNAAKGFVALIPPAENGWVGGTVTAFDAQGNELEQKQVAQSDGGFDFAGSLDAAAQVSPPAIGRTMGDLDETLRYFESLHEETGSFLGWNKAKYEAYLERPISVDTSAIASEGFVSVRVSGPDSLVLAERVPDGRVFCAATSTGNIASMTLGQTDAQTPAECQGGWLPPNPTG
jgi:hypothetical protein